MKISLNALSVIVMLLVVALVIAQVVVAIKVSSFGKQLTAIEKEYAGIVQANQEIREEIAYNQSLLLVASKSLELGLARPNQILYLTPPDTRMVWISEFGLRKPAWH